MRLFVAVVNYGRADLTIDCLETAVPEARAVSAQGLGPCVIGVCDNGSTDDSPERLAREIEARGWDDCVELTGISPNRGFTGGNNAIIAPALESDDPPDFVLLLNNDTLVRAGAFSALLEFLDEHPEVGIVGPRLEWPSGEPQISCFRDFSPVSEFVSGAQTGPITRVLRRWDVPLPVVGSVSYPGWTSFACAMIRAEVFRGVGLLDEGYFLYYDDPDYCRRARSSGWLIANHPAARVAHLRGQSNPQKALAASKQRQPWYRYASRTRYYRKHYGVLGPLIANCCWTAGYAIDRLRMLLGRPPSHSRHEVVDIWTNFLRPLAMPGKGQDG